MDRRFSAKGLGDCTGDEASALLAGTITTSSTAADGSAAGTCDVAAMTGVGTATTSGSTGTYC